MPCRTLVCGAAFLSILFVGDAWPDGKPAARSSTEGVAAPGEHPAEDGAVRPFASKDQQRREVHPRLTTNVRVPRGGSCLPRMNCGCTEVDSEHYCVGPMRCESTTFENHNCRYLCFDPYLCDTISDDDCKQSNPCS